MRVIALILSASAMTLLALTGIAPAQTPAGTMRFAILRNGEQIGTHAIEISRSGP